MDANVSLERSENVSNTSQLNISRIQSFLLSEFEKKNELKISMDKIESLKKTQSSNLQDYDQIYRFKLEKTRGDAMFSNINQASRLNGTLLGTNINNYLNHFHRYNLSKDLVSEAQVLERSWVRNFTDFLSQKLWRYRFNYLFKGVVVVGLYSSVKGFTNVLRHSSNAEQMNHELSVTWIPQRVLLFTTLTVSALFV